MTFVDPSGLDVRVLATVPYLNPRAGGPIYVQKWTSYPTFEAFVNAMEYAPNGSVHEIIIEGHGLWNQMGCDPHDNSNRAAIRYKKVLDQRSLRIKLENGALFDLSQLGLEEKGVKKIQLRGCGTAGGYPNDSKAPGLAERAGYPLSYATDRKYYPVTHDNIARAISEVVPSAEVVGVQGPGALNFADWSTVPTQSYRNGVPLR